MGPDTRSLSLSLLPPRTTGACASTEVCKWLGRGIWGWGAEVSWEDILWTAQGLRCKTSSIAQKPGLIPFFPISPSNQACLKAGGYSSVIFWDHTLLPLLKDGSEMQTYFLIAAI